MPVNPDLEREVFGGSDSELSSDENEELQDKSQARISRRKDVEESSGADSEDDYQECRATQKLKKRTSEGRKGIDERERRPVQRKRKRKTPVEIDLSELPPEQASKIRLDMQIEAILKPKKASRQRKKKNNDEVLDSFADDEVARLREAMNTAAEEDIRANSEKLPATAKLKLLPEAMDTLRKASLAQSMIDNNLLEGVKRWLEPLPDRSLPALNIQREFFNIIKKMEFIDSSVLKESGLGRVVLFYTKCKRVTPDIARIANDLVSTWSRPIIKRSASYRDRVIPVAQDGGEGVDMRAGEKLNAILARAKEAEKGRVKRNAVMIPQRELGSYTVAPKLNAGIGRGSLSVDVDIERRRKNAERLRTLTRKVTMKRSNGLSPLAIVLPHPPLPRRRSSLLSANSASAPHTPRSCASPACSSIFLAPAANRKSTDSWNSSNAADDQEFEWKSDQVRLLSRTLDALPAHLVTPFNGPIPPSNLLDKIARGVSEAKGPIDWPHSIRATRVKLIELARLKAKEDSLERRRGIAEVPEIEIDDGSNYSYYHNGAENPLNVNPVGLGSRRPLYRQSSMDFMNVAGTNLKENDNITKLSNRLQRTGYHPYSRPQIHRRSSSPPRSEDVPSLINPSTPSSSTLNTLSSLASHPRALRRTTSSLSSTSISMLSNSSNGMLQDPRVQRVRRSDSFCAPAPVPPPKDMPASSIGVKRAPSFGALAQEAKKEAGQNRHGRKNSASYPSSDEEEKIRTRKAKKPRMKTSATPASSRMDTPPPSSPSVMSSSPAQSVDMAPSPPIKDRTPVRKSKGPVTCLEVNTKILKSPSTKIKGTHGSEDKPASKKEGEKRPTKMNLQRNPSMFGAELPQLRCSPNVPVSPTLKRSRSPPVPAPTRALSPSVPIVLSPPATIIASPPPTQKVKTLRRVRRLAPARRISFGSLAPGDEADADGEGEDDLPSGTGRGCLGSAFQLH
ncbi:hypothetical protein BDQ12DRAFT_721632 [Crucibulum laeve]|uniref:TFIIS N-terminal domain-containing protein n=1 Tax=Crucibulum laeve TaxID=68775 RepID=A0A5C3M6A0_9AGAR|nr:hypothetical protein BDQ12DRAFT_721632 [Crucibulum laeve]